MTNLLHTRDAAAQELVELGKRHTELVLVEADLGKSTKSYLFAREFPERYFQMGIAEQNQFGVAAGMAMSGKLPVVVGYSVFASMKACEQIRTFMAYPDLNIKIVASHGGLTAGNDGPTHQAIEDLGIIRSIPNTIVVAPADAIATRSLVRAAVEEIRGLVYIRLTRDPLPVIYKKGTKFTIGKAIEFRSGSDATIIAIGDMVNVAIKAAEELEVDNISVRIIDMHTLKPLDKEIVIRAAQETHALISVEDHNIYGGLGSAVAEVIAEECPGTSFKRVGIHDTFAESGEYHLLLKKYGLDVSNIKTAVKDVIKSKI